MALQLRVLVLAKLGVWKIDVLFGFHPHGPDAASLGPSNVVNSCLGMLTCFPLSSFKVMISTTCKHYCIGNLLCAIWVTPYHTAGPNDVALSASPQMGFPVVGPATA